MQTQVIYWIYNDTHASFVTYLNFEIWKFNIISYLLNKKGTYNNDVWTFS